MIIPINEAEKEFLIHFNYEGKWFDTAWFDQEFFETAKGLERRGIIKYQLHNQAGDKMYVLTQLGHEIIKTLFGRYV